MSPEAWQFLGLAVVQVAGLVTIWLKVHGTRDSVDEAVQVAGEAREFARPVGNGFANEVLTALREIKADVSQNTEALEQLRGRFEDHLRDHSNGMNIPRQRRWLR